MKDKQKYQRCTKGLWDSSIPDISFDAQGVSNYYKRFRKLDDAFGTGDSGYEILSNKINQIKKQKTRSKYDCIIGLSGGTDSSYLLHLAVNEWGLKPLAVNLDNGWSTNEALSNIKKVTSSLSVDLVTYVIDYEEVKAVFRAYMKAGMPWVDAPTDLAIKSVLYTIAAEEGIKTIFLGTDFRSEGKQPVEWTYCDYKQFQFIIRKFEDINLKTFPAISLYQQMFFGFFLGIEIFNPFYHIDYIKSKAQVFLSEKYDWKYYGGHHHENLFTRFAIAYWLPKKFQIDKRLITLSAQVISGELERDEAIKEISKSPYDEVQMERDKKTVLKKLDITEDKFNQIWTHKNKSFKNYPSYYNFFQKNKKLIKRYHHLFLSQKPKMLIAED